MPFLAFQIDQLLPAAGVIIWLIIHIVTSIKNDKTNRDVQEAERKAWAEARERMLQRQQTEQAPGQGTPTSEDEARALQEAIRRRYAAQRGESAAPEAPATAEPARPRYDPFKSDREQTSAPAPRYDAPRPVPPPLRPAARVEAPVAPAPTVTTGEDLWGEPATPKVDYMALLAEQQRMLNDMERRHRVTMESLGQTVAPSSTMSMRSAFDGLSLPAIEAVPAMLTDPEAGQKAIVLAEILGKPLALRGAGGLSA